MGLYIIFLYGGNSVMPLISGFVIDRAGWRWFCWLCAIISCLNFLAIFFFVEETRFERSHTPISRQTSEVLKEKTSATDNQEEHLEKVNVSTTENSPIAVDEGHELTGTKKSYLRTLSLWSGTSEQSFFSHFMRPYLMIVYPAVIWATVTCK
jgi:MFS family permease